MRESEREKEIVREGQSERVRERERERVRERARAYGKTLLFPLFSMFVISLWSAV